MPANMPSFPHPPASKRRKAEEFSRKVDEHNAHAKKLGLASKIRILFTLKKLATDQAMIEKLKSRKLWITVLGAAITALAAALGLDPDLAAKIIGGLTATYVVSQGVVDAVAASKKP